MDAAGGAVGGPRPLWGPETAWNAHVWRPGAAGPARQPAGPPGDLGLCVRNGGRPATATPGPRVAGPTGSAPREVEVALPTWPPRPHGAPAAPALVPLLAMKLAMSTCLPSMDRFRMQPTNCRFRTGKSSGRLGTPPRSSGPVRSRDLRKQGQPLRWRGPKGGPGVAMVTVASAAGLARPPEQQ